MPTHPEPIGLIADSASRAGRIKLVARSTLGLIWLYLGLFPKLLWQVPEEITIVERTGLFVVSPPWTIAAVGVLEVVCGVWLLTGWQERAAVGFTTAFMVAMMVPAVLVEPSRRCGGMKRPGVGRRSGLRSGLR